MIDLTKPEARRAVRTIVQAIVQFALIAFVWSLIDNLHGDVGALREIARISLGIVALGELGYAMENGARAIKFSVSKDGASGEAEGDSDVAK